MNAQADLDQKNEKISELNQSIVRLETTLVHERRVSGEKVAILDDATQKLSDAFKALSAEALKSNNQSFLDLAKTTLEKYQVEAKGDLEQRQKAVENLVTPIKQSLEKVDTHVRELRKHASLHTEPNRTGQVPHNHTGSYSQKRVIWSRRSGRQRYGATGEKYN